MLNVLGQMLKSFRIVVRIIMFCPSNLDVTFGLSNVLHTSYTFTFINFMLGWNFSSFNGQNYLTYSVFHLYRNAKIRTCELMEIFQKCFSFIQGGHSIFKRRIQEFSRSFPGDFMIFPGVFIKDCSDIM